MDFIKSFITDAGALIIMYAPVVLSYVTQIISWIVSYKKIAKLNVHKQIAPLVEEIKDLKDSLNKITEQNSQVIAENEELKNKLIEANKTIEETLTSQSKILDEIVQENVKLRADVRRKTNERKQSNETV